jgi:hypothetical protein
MALKEAIKEGIYLYNLISYFNNNLKIGYNIPKPEIFEDNNAALELTKNQTFHKRTKHIDIIYHFNRYAVKENLVKITRINTKNNLADWLTKPIIRQDFKLAKERCNIKEKE